MRIRRSNKLPLSKRLWQKILINNLADLIILQTRPKDKLDTNTIRALLRRMPAHGIEFLAFNLDEGIRAGLDCSIDAGAVEYTSTCNILERCNQVFDDSLAVLVEDLAGTEILDVLEILGRGGSEDFVAGSYSELDWRCYQHLWLRPRRVESCQLVWDSVTGTEALGNLFETSRKLRSRDTMEEH